MTKETRFDFTITGFVIAIIFVSLFATVFGVFASELQTNYGTEGNTSLTSYQQFENISNNAEEIKDASAIKQNVNALDIIGAFFSSGYSALKISFNSIELFQDLGNQASNDIPGFSLFRDYLNLFIIIALVLGVGIAALLKWRT